MLTTPSAEVPDRPDRSDRWRLLRAGWFPWALLAAVLPLVPVYRWLGATAARRRYAEDPPACYGLGFGCDPSPDAQGDLAAVSFALALVLIAAVVGLLHLGNERLALTRSVVAIIGLALLLVLPIVGTLTAGV